MTNSDESKQQKSVLIQSLGKTAFMASWLGGILLVVYMFSGIYSIQSNEVGVLLRFGSVIDQAVPPGIHVALPWPIDRVITVPVHKAMRLSIDDFAVGSDLANAFGTATGLSSYVVTGDNNIVMLGCVLQYTIDNPVFYLFHWQQNERVLHSFACNSLLHCLAGTTIDDILTTGKESIQNTVRLELQKELNDRECGVSITFVELNDVRPPPAVQRWFHDVINARIDKDKTINTALSYRNEKIPEAKGNAERMTQTAKAYRQRVTDSAQGDAERFLSHVSEYQRSPVLTRQRLYFEMLQEILPKVQKKFLVAQTRDGKQPLVRLISPGNSGGISSPGSPAQKNYTGRTSSEPAFPRMWDEGD